MQIIFGRKFKKSYQKADKKIQKLFNRRLKLFLQNPLDSSLNNHALSGKYKKYRSINVTGDWRALYSESTDLKGEVVILFEVLGTHSQLYK